MLYSEDDLEEARAKGRAEGEASARANGPSASDVNNAFERGRLAGAESERERIKAVLSSDAAKNDPVMAARLALAPGTTSENLATNLRHVAEARQLAADASWDAVLENMGVHRERNGRKR